MNTRSSNWRVIMRASVTIGCSSYILLRNPAIVDAGPLLGLLKMGDMANVFMECISKEILGVSSGEAYLEAMMRKKEFWAVAKHTIYWARIDAILKRCWAQEVWAVMTLGVTIAYGGACTFCLPLMFAGTLITDGAARAAKPLRNCVSLSMLTAVLGFACFL